MIKFAGTDPDGPIVGIGLTAVNLLRLRERQPISTDLEPLIGVNARLVIFYGETELAIYQDLKEAGIVDDQVELRELSEDAYAAKTPAQQFRKMGPLQINHPLVGEVCPVCERQMIEGDHVTLVSTAPADEQEAEKALMGRPHMTIAKPIHWDCRPGSEVSNG